MNVLNIYRTYYPDPPGGLQEAIRQICLATNSFDISNNIFTLSPSPNPKVITREEARVFRFRSWCAPASCDIGGVDAFRSFNQLVQKNDVLHYFHPWPFADVLSLGLKYDRPAVMTYISDIVRQRFLGKLYQPLMWKTLDRMQLIVSNCPSYVETSPVLSHPSIRSKVRVIPLGIDEHSYPAVTDNSYLNLLGLDSDEPYFLFIGVLRYYKGLHTLITAAKAVDAKIVIAGCGPEETSLKNMVDELELDNIIFTGFISDIQKVTLLQGCRALLLPSHLRSEAYGMVLVEASMFGKPMISCEIGTGTSFINQHEKTGFVIQPENESELAVGMNTLLNDANLAYSMGAVARERYEKMFSSDALGRAYTAVYKELL